MSVQGAGIDVQGTVDVLRSDGESGGVVANARVLLYSTQSMSETTSDADGKFTFTGVAPGSYRLSAKAIGFIAVNLTSPFEVGPGQRSPSAIAVHFTKFQNCADSYQLSYGETRSAKRARVYIEVLNHVNKRPIPGATIVIQQSDRSLTRLSRITDHKGKVSISDLNPGFYLIATNRKGFHSEEETVWLPTNNPAHLKQFLISNNDIIVCQ